MDHGRRLVEIWLNDIGRTAVICMGHHDDCNDRGSTAVIWTVLGTILEAQRSAYYDRCEPEYQHC